MKKEKLHRVYIELCTRNQKSVKQQPIPRLQAYIDLQTHSLLNDDKNNQNNTARATLLVAQNVPGPVSFLLKLFVLRRKDLLAVNF